MTWTLYEGDCLEIMPTLPDKSINLILSDLPYGITSRNKWDVVIPFDKLWEQYERVIRDSGVIILTASGLFTADLMKSNKSIWRYNLVWEKTTPTGFLNANRMPLRIHEDILVFYKSLPTYNPQKTTGHPRKVSTAKHKINCKETSNYSNHGLTTYDSTDRFPTSVLKFPTDKQKKSLHPTQKPVSLFEYLINTYTNAGDTVLDNCAGSGTTGVAAERCGRHSIMIEKEPQYCEIIRNRMKESLVS